MQRVNPASALYRRVSLPPTVMLRATLPCEFYPRRVRKGSVVVPVQLTPPTLPYVIPLQVFTLTQFLRLMFLPSPQRMDAPPPLEDSLETFIARDVAQDVPSSVSYPLPEHSLHVPFADGETIDALMRDYEPDESVRVERQEKSYADLTPEELLFEEDLYPSASQAAVRDFIKILHQRGYKHWRLKDELTRLGYVDDPEYGVTAMSQLYSRMRIFMQQRLRDQLAEWIEEPTRREYRAIRFRFHQKCYVAIIDFAQRGEHARLEFKAFMPLAQFSRTMRRPRLNKPGYRNTRRLNRRG